MRLFALLGFALILRVLAAGWGGPITEDGVLFYLPSAAGLLEGDLDRGMPPTHHPGYPMVIALLELLGIGPEWAGRWVSVVAGSLTVIPLFHIGRRLGGRRTGWLAASLLAVLPIHLQYSGWVQTEALFTLFVAVTLERLIAFAQGAGSGALVVAGLVAGAGAWVRGEALLFTALLPLAALGRDRGDRRWGAVVIAAGLLVVIALGTTVQFYRQTGHFTYSPGSQIVFVLGQQDPGPHRFDCFFEIAPSGDQLGFYYATTREGFEPGLKLRYVMEDPPGFLLRYLGDWWRLAVRFAPKGLDNAWLPAFLIGIGLLCRRSAPAGARLPLVQLFVMTAGLAAYFVQKRFWIPLAPATLAATSVGFDWLWQRSGARRWARGLVCLLALAVVPGVIDVFNFDEGWNASVARGRAAELRRQVSIHDGELVLARGAAVPFYAGWTTSELPTAAWDEALAYFDRRGARAILVDARDAEARQWTAGLLANGAESIRLGGDDVFLLMRPRRSR